MNKVSKLKFISIISFLLFFTVFIPLPGANNIARATATTVVEENQEVKLNVKKNSMVKDTTYTLILYNLTETQKVSFKSSDSEIASVDKDGVVTALKVGEATITVTVKEGFRTVSTLTCDITVGPPAISVKLKKSEINLVVDKSTLLEVILKPNNTLEDPKYSSKDIAIATVSSNGRITAKSVGTTYVFCSISNGLYEKVLVNVVATEAELEKLTEESKTKTMESENSTDSNKNTESSSTSSKSAN